MNSETFSVDLVINMYLHKLSKNLLVPRYMFSPIFEPAPQASKSGSLTTTQAITAI